MQYNSYAMQFLYDEIKAEERCNQLQYVGCNYAIRSLAVLTTNSVGRAYNQHLRIPLRTDIQLGSKVIARVQNYYKGLFVALSLTYS